ncbi:MAG: HD-GYP domain-containing protein [Deltaproteobacteria bacterium]|nr:HD-GYP domain-containing protein [Deltaproteobacteria bacterium]MBI3079523.1 HD-GYP domain-containing protein [Deltaproteobacteria bacterium]
MPEVSQVHDKLEGILKGLNRAVRGRSLYPAGHPAIVQPVRESHLLLTGLLASKPRLVLGMVEGLLVFEEETFYDTDGKFPELAARFAQHNLQKVSFLPGVTVEELGVLVTALARGGSEGKDALAGVMAAAGVRHIEVGQIAAGPEELPPPRQVYADALQTVIDAFRDVRLGKIPRADRARRVVQDMADYVLRDRSSMLGLAMLKSYDEYTFNHSVNVCIISLAMGEALKLKGAQLAELGMGALLHDIGKTLVALDLIRKPARLAPQEFEEVKRHPITGAEIVAKMEGVTEPSVQAVLEHHAQYNLQGYPSLTEVDRPSLFGMIVALGDCYDALTTLRCYQRRYSPYEAVEIIRGLAGTNFDPDLARIFIDMMGMHPIGSLVRLSSNELAVVARVHPEDPLRPTVKVIFDREGGRLPEARQIDLREAGVVIAGAMDPALKGIDVGAFL